MSKFIVVDKESVIEDETKDKDIVTLYDESDMDVKDKQSNESVIEETEKNNNGLDDDKKVGDVNEKINDEIKEIDVQVQEENKLIRESINYEKYIPERLMTLSDDELIRKIKDIGKEGNIDLLKKIRNLLLQHGYKKSFLDIVDSFLIYSNKYKITKENLMKLSIDELRTFALKKFNISIDTSKEKKYIVDNLFELASIMADASKY